MPGNADLIEELALRLRDIRERKAEAAELTEKLNAANGELASLRVTASSPDGTVTVTAGAGGIVTEVALTDAATRLGAAGLAEAITDAVRRASMAAAREQVAIVRAHAGREIDPADVLGPQAHLAAAPVAPPIEDDEPGWEFLKELDDRGPS